MINAEAFYSEIIHFADNTLIQLEARWVNSQAAPQYLNKIFSTSTPNEYLSKSCPLSAIEHTVEAHHSRLQHPPSTKANGIRTLLASNRRTWEQGTPYQLCITLPPWL
ncbi:UTRA domain-containing protein [Vibrio chagasii]|nr:UTRA domain-containing protein [Vibrio chagasii]